MNMKIKRLLHLRPELIVYRYANMNMHAMSVTHYAFHSACNERVYDTSVYSGYLTGMICTICTATVVRRHSCMELVCASRRIYLVLAGCGTVCKINEEWVRAAFVYVQE